MWGLANHRVMTLEGFHEKIVTAQTLRPVQTVFQKQPQKPSTTTEHELLQMKRTSQVSETYQEPPPRGFSRAEKSSAPGPPALDQPRASAMKPGAQRTGAKTETGFGKEAGERTKDKTETKDRARLLMGKKEALDFDMPVDCPISGRLRGAAF